MIKRLELVGFKSFAKKSVIDLDSPVTAIVGPNGSGKSNVAEALKFVLGEQSIKSLRGKSGSDLIFKGSRNLSPLNRASVSIVFDNKKRVFSVEEGEVDGVPNLDFDEIVVTREVFQDGTNQYKINGTQVRLKDVVSLLSRVNIGTSGHHIISQGEADRILSATLLARREMIEDALGLKLYRYRIKESERKLLKTKENMREAEISRREIAPHLTFLKKQVEKIEKGNAMRDELAALYEEYLSYEFHYLSYTQKKLDHEGGVNHIKHEIVRVEKELAHVKQEREKEEGEDTGKQAISESNHALSVSKGREDDAQRKVTRAEAIYEVEKRLLDELKVRAHNTDGSTIRISENEIRSITKETEETVKQILWRLDRHEYVEAKTFLNSLKERISTFFTPFLHESKNDSYEEEIKRKEERLVALKHEFEQAEKELKHAREERLVAEEHVRRVEAEYVRTKEDSAKHEREFFTYSTLLHDLQSKLEVLTVKESMLAREQEAFEQEIKEGAMLLGARVLSYKHKDAVPHEELERPDFRDTQAHRRRAIERIKIKLEDIGGGNVEDISKEFADVNERDQFLAREIDDLGKASASIESLIVELNQKLETEFKEGIAHINKAFDTFFKAMFEGGNASIALLREPKRGKIVLEGDEEMVEEEKEKEEGIDILVSLPQKKVKDLSMLSGGERALTSIALLFAISQVNPPPFLVLDETDAALDEANSKRYGSMIENLSKHSRLIVITHNRETMSRAKVLYGVTVGADGSSKLLSIRLEEAEAIAK